MMTVTAAAILFVQGTQAKASSDVVYILDASNSMWGQIEGTAKIETARSVMGDLLSNASPGTQIGLIAYGHRSEGECSDIEILANVGQASTVALKDSLAGLQPKGKTPIAGALQEAKELLAGREGKRNIVLISDGIETCGGDPCAIAAELAADGVGTKVHAVGFDVDSAAREQLECIAEKGQGSYYNASSASELQLALNEVAEVVQAEEPPAPPPTPEPTSEQVFFDDFTGDLAEHWSVQNADIDSYIVEDSNLFMINNAVGDFRNADTRNIVVLGQDMPSGDWDATITFTGEFKTGRDTVMFGLYKDDQNFLTGRIFTSTGSATCNYAALGILKMASGEATEFKIPLIGSQMGCGALQVDAFAQEVSKHETTPMTMTLHKRGRSYHVSASRGEADGPEDVIYETDRLSSLRSPGALALTVGKYNKADGEVMVMIDSVEVTSITK
ncbi:MAG: VWA domain-containing protein [Pseudomonadota bacterium]